MNVRTLYRLWLVVHITLAVMYSTAPAAGDATTGKATYERLCVNCHGPDGRGGSMARMLPVPPRNLADQAYMATRSDQQLFTVISQGGAAVGLSAAMSAFGTQLSVQELWDTVAYVRTFPALTHTPTGAPETVSPGMGGPSIDLRMARLHLSIWPEYDDPRVLIMFRGEMAPHSAFPTHITLPLPKGAEVIGAGMISEQGELLLHPHQVRPGEADDSLDINLPVARFFVEFYYNPFAEGTDKRFTYAVPTTYPIERLEVDIQQPLQAMRFTTDPQAISRETDERGFTYHRFLYHTLGKGDIRRFTVTYTKPVAGPSVAKSQPASEISQPPRTAVHALVLAFGMLGGAAVVFGGGTLLWTRYQRRRHASPTHQSPAVAPPAAVQSSHAQTTFAPTPMTSGRHTPNFCSNCGAKLRPEYHFCPGCGRSFPHET